MVNGAEQRRLRRERLVLLRRVERWLEWPLIGLGLLWLVLLVLELVSGLSPFLRQLVQVIWGVFILEFAVRLALAPDRRRFLGENWLTLVTLLLPALRVLRFFRLLRVLRGVRLVRIVGSLNRGMRALGRSMGRRGLGYVVALTIIVLITGAAGMYAFERDAPGGGFSGYGDALWWTAMLLTTIGSQYWPATPEGRALTLLLSLYAIGVFGYLAASLASFFVGREAESTSGQLPSARAVRALQRDVAALREQLRAGNGGPGSGGGREHER